jgi:hypothetical protein
MNRTVRALLGVAAFAATSALSLTHPAQAQQVGAGLSGPTGLTLDLVTMLKAKPGAWADYTMAGKGAERPLTIRYALIDHTAARLALEIDSATPKGEMVIHFDFVSQGVDAWKVVAGKVQMGEQKMDLPTAQLETMPALKTSDSPGELVGNEDVTTPLGSFACKHYRRAMAEGGKGPVIDVWLSDKVSPTGLVKSTLDVAGVQMSLAATGTGALSKLH